VGDKQSKLDTQAVHAGEERRNPDSALTVPIRATATYTFANTAELIDHFEGRTTREEYGRYGNPTVTVAETKIAALDSADDCCLFSSGMSAVTTTLLTVLKAGQHVIMTDDCYRRTRQFVTTTLSRFGIEHTIVKVGDYDALEAAIRPQATKIILGESPTNPYLQVEDLPRLADIAKRHRIKTVIDSTFATPINQRPCEFGIDLVIHSATKYLAGHNDILAGSVSGRSGLVSAIRETRSVLGGVLDPHAAYLLIRGLKTLHLRVERQNASGMAVAMYLEAHPRVRRVFYPGLASHPNHTIAAAQMTGFGGVVSFEVDSDLEGTSRFIDACSIPRIAPSLGGVESLIEQPALMSFFELSTEEREAVGIVNNLVRLSLGIEDVDDLIRDVGVALEQV
jgi:cystathionine gamma-synthase